MREHRGLWALSALLTLPAGVLVTLAADLPAPPAPFHLPWWALVPLFALADAVTVNLRFRRGSYVLSLSYLVTTVGLVLARPLDLVVGAVVGGALALAGWRRMPLRKVVFNLCHTAQAVATATLVVAPFSERLLAPGGWVSVALAAAAAALTSYTAIFVALTVQEGRLRLRRYVRSVVPSALTLTALVAVALLAVRTALLDPSALALLALPVGLLWAAYRVHTADRERLESLSVLHRAAQHVSAASDLDRGIDAVLDLLRERFRAGSAELLLSREEHGAPGFLRTIRSDGGGERTVAVPEAEAHTVQAVVDAGEPLVLAEADASPDTGLGAYMSLRSEREGVAVLLRGRDATLGLLVLSGPLNETASFADDDLELLTTLARQLTTVLEKGELQRSLSEVTRLQQQLAHQALHDPLTGLGNRSLLMDRLGHALRRSARDRRHVALLFLDLDGFKPVNDTYGHDAGDRVLQAVADRLRGRVRASDTTGRLGGDEFVVLAEGLDEQEAARLADDLLDTLRAPIDVGTVTVAVQASIGVALAHTGTADELLQAADAAMYTAKRRGPGKVQVAERRLSSPV